MNESDIRREVELVISERVQCGEVTVASWVIQSVMSRHASLEGLDVEWYQVASRCFLQTEVARAVRRYKINEDQAQDGQMVLEGFERLQVAYSIVRNGQQSIVPLHLCTTQELEEKVLEMEGMRTGLQSHIDELRRVIAGREGRGNPEPGGLGRAL